MSEEAATQLLEKMKEDENYSDIMQYSMYYINLIQWIINGDPISDKQYELLIENLKSDVNDTRKTYRKEASLLLNCLQA
jgi:hypothetical protein